MTCLDGRPIEPADRSSDPFWLIKREYRDSLFLLPNVTGVGIGYKVTRGIITDKRSIRIYVVEKKPLSDLADNESVPEFLGDLPTDVIEIGELTAQAYTAKERPALSGASLGTTAALSTGTLGARLIDNTDATGVVLSCNHILSLADDVVRNAAIAGTPVIQPGQSDGGAIADQIAELKRWIKFVFPPSWNRVDAAIAEIIGPLKASARIHDIGRYNGWRSVYPIDEGITAVKKVGRTTELTTGLIDDVSYDTSYDYGYGVVQFEDQILIQGAPFSSSGDSGSVVLDLQSRIIGVVWKGGPFYTTASPIDAVLNQLDISPCPRC